MAEFRYVLRRFLHFSEMAAESEGVSAQQYQLLQVVGGLSEDTRASISAIAERMVLRHHSAVELVDRAERLKLVARAVDPDDLRRAIVTLTERGRAVLQTLAAAHLRELSSTGPLMVEALQRLSELQTASRSR